MKLDKNIENAAHHVLSDVLWLGARQSTKYLIPSLVVRATVRTYKIKQRTTDPVEILLTIGKPNYKERQFIKDCKKAGEPFPVNEFN